MFAYQFIGLQNVADKNGWTKFIAMQNQYSLIYREEEREMIPACKELGVGYEIHLSELKLVVSRGGRSRVGYLHDPCKKRRLALKMDLSKASRNRRNSKRLERVLSTVSKNSPRRRALQWRKSRRHGPFRMTVCLVGVFNL